MNSVTGKRVLVTGGAGFIGSHLVDRLLEMNNRVVVIDNFDDFYPGKERNIRAHVNREDYTLVNGDILDRALLGCITKGIDLIIHEAAQAGIRYCNINPWKAHKVNVEGTLSVLMAARDNNVGRLIYASSSSIFGNPSILPIDETCPANPTSPYGATKLAGEQYCLSFHQVYGLDVVSLRYFSVYGPRGRPDQVIYSLAQKMIRGESPVIYGNGDQRRDFTHVSDVVEATILAAQAEGIKGEVFNIGFGKDYSIKELLRIMIENLPDRPPNVSPVYVERYKGDFGRNIVDNTKARARLGWKPSVDLENGVREFLTWFGQASSPDERKKNP